ncbi:MAG: hypothetical protein LBO75_05050 [Bifidobacteriaceae bacterium]|nr:hypothetical protein [Bifidobacteriaceae bacterium]
MSVYLLSSAADTTISRAIRLGTGNRQGHLSVVFLQDDELRCYSFARRRWSTPLDGAFVEEGRDRYTYPGGRVTSMVLYEIPLERQGMVRRRLEHLRPHLETCGYNLPDALVNALGWRFRSRVAYTCVGFCALMLGLDRERGVVQLAQVLQAAEAQPVYQGDLEGLERFTGARFWEGDSQFYAQRLPKAQAVATAVGSQLRALGSIIKDKVARRSVR